MSDEYNRQDIAKELLRRRAARSSLIAFTQFTFPGYVAEGFHRVLGDYLDRVVNGDCKRLMVFAPPQHYSFVDSK